MAVVAGEEEEWRQWQWATMGVVVLDYIDDDDCDGAMNGDYEDDNGDGAMDDYDDGDGDDHGVRRVDTARAHARWWHIVASHEATNMLHQAMCLTC